MSHKALRDISMLESRYAELMRRLDAKVSAVSETGNSKEAVVAQHWQKEEHDALEDWKAAESHVLKEWRERETIGMEEWKEREQISALLDRDLFELSKLLNKDKRTFLETEVDRTEARYEKVKQQIEQRSTDVLYCLRPDQQRLKDDMEKRHQTRRPNRQLELWNEIRRLEEVAKRQQVDRMLQKGELITELEERAEKEKEEREYREFMEQEERKRKELEERRLKSREKEHRRFVQGMLVYLTTHSLRPDSAVSTSSRQSASAAPTLTSAHLLADSIHKGRVSLEARIALLGAFRFLTEVDLARGCAPVSREFHQMLQDERLCRERLTNMKHRLEDVGFHFIKVPAGTYALGKPPHVPPERVCDPQSNNTVAPYFCDQVEYSLPGDCHLSDGLITVRGWQRLVKAFPHLGGLVTEKDVELCRYNVIHPSAGGEREATVVEKDVQEEDPALELPFDRCTVIARSLGMRLPTWQEWEAAVRGPKSHLYAWGDEYDPVRVETEVMIHGWRGPNPNYGKPNRMGLKDTAVEVHHSLALSRLCNWGAYADTVTELGLRDVLRFGKEWNSANRDVLCHLPEERVDGQVLRSGCDLHSVNDVHSWETPVKDELLTSNHRAFSGPMAFCLRPPKFFGGGKLAPRAAFRLAFRLDPE
eukprot:GGOE01014377.1.p1 GENE.GGOE01014377.1~~GGOE01014377.1.p1  ORF type:complete len:648 (-),score=263.01 GGOE01014377.1:249-2192(-)